MSSTRITPTLVLLCATALGGCKAPPGDRALTLYGGRFIDNGLPDEILLGDEWNELDSWIGVAALSRVFKRTTHADWEVEGQFGQHFGDQDHFEVNALVAYRWRTFPWNDWLRTSFALGEGLSLASEVPELEDETEDDGSRRFLNYLLLEWTFGAPSGRGPDLVFRIHHRSGVAGLFGGVEGGSNLMTFGLRFEF